LPSNISDATMASRFTNPFGTNNAQGRSQRNTPLILYQG